MALPRWSLPAVMSGCAFLDLGEPASSWAGETLDCERIFGRERSVEDPEKAWLNQPESREGKSPKLRTLALLEPGALVLDAVMEVGTAPLSLALDGRGGLARGLLLDGGSMITGASVIAAPGDRELELLAADVSSESSDLFLEKSLLPFLPTILELRVGVSLPGSTPPPDERGLSLHSGLRNLDNFGVELVVDGPGIG